MMDAPKKSQPNQSLQQNQPLKPNPSQKKGGSLSKTPNNLEKINNEQKGDQI